MVIGGSQVGENSFTTSVEAEVGAGLRSKLYSANFRELGAAPVSTELHQRRPNLQDLDRI